MNFLIKLAIFSSLVAFVGPGFAQEPTADVVVDTMEKLNGVTVGARRNHIRGICVSGTFVGSARMHSYTTSPLFSGQDIPLIGRFSLAGGNPNAPDVARSPRGLAIEFKLPNNELHHFTMLNVPIFSAASPQTFLDSMVANLPDPQSGKPDPQKLQQFRANHPDAQPLAEFMAKNNPPASYARSNFFSVHTFKFINSNKQSTLVRWRFEPEAGVQRLTDDEIKNAPSRFLDNDLLARVKQSPLRWNMIVTLGEPTDEQVNPTVYWPEGRKQIQAGVLTLNNALPQPGAACEGINFDPLVMASGIEPTLDPVLLFRSPAYATSFAKRLTGQ